MVAARDELLKRGDGVSADRYTFDIERECLAGELPGRVVVLERDLRAGDAQVLGLHVQSGQGNNLFHLLFDVADRDQSGLVRCCYWPILHRNRGEGAGETKAQKSSNKQTSPSLPLCSGNTGGNVERHTITC